MKEGSLSTASKNTVGGTSCSDKVGQNIYLNFTSGDESFTLDATDLEGR